MSGSYLALIDLHPEIADEFLVRPRAGVLRTRAVKQSGRSPPPRFRGRTQAIQDRWSKAWQ